MLGSGKGWFLSSIVYHCPAAVKSPREVVESSALETFKKNLYIITSMGGFMLILFSMQINGTQMTTAFSAE